MTNNIHMRWAVPEDAAEVLEIYRPHIEEGIASFEEVVPPVEDIANRIETTLKSHPWIVAVDGDRIAGYAYAGVHRGRPAYRWTTETTIYMHPDYHRRGIARKLYTVLLELLRQQGFHLALAGITLPNEASREFHRSMGFEPFAVFDEVGFKFGTWHPTEWWDLKITPGIGQPRELIPFSVHKNHSDALNLLS